MCDHAVSQALLEWYDHHARVLPWRVSPADRRAGIKPDPYRVWLSEIMLQQTTVAAVKSYFETFTTRWPTVQDLANADDADVMAAWAGLGYYARARNLLKCARVIRDDHDGMFPDTYADLIKLPGIGPYTAAAVASIAFDLQETVVDGNVERVMSRLHDVETPLPPAKPELTELAAQHTPTARAGDYAQSVMDLGATICTPRNPACGICPVMSYCKARASGHQATLPRKVPKKVRPTRHGIAYIVQRTDGAFLLETRPESGLLGGMLGWPTTQWDDDPAPDPPLDADWCAMNTEARHTFTHFHLKLKIITAKVTMDATPSRGKFVVQSQFARAALPTVMRKAYDLAIKNFPDPSLSKV